jgi:hypothetical protein
MTPDPREVESIKRAAEKLLYQIRAMGVEMEPEFMEILSKLAENPVREAQ